MGIQKYTYASTVTLFFLNISCEIDRKGSNLFKVFLIMFEFSYLSVIIQKTAMLGLAERMSHKL